MVIGKFNFAKINNKFLVGLSSIIIYKSTNFVVGMQNNVPVISFDKLIIVIPCSVGFSHMTVRSAMSEHLYVHVVIGKF